MHGDAHVGNWMIQPNEDGTYTQTTIDFDNAQRSWFITDIGTVVWTANMQWYFDGYESNPNYAEGFGNYKTWLMDAYSWDTTEEELQ